MDQEPDPERLRQIEEAVHQVPILDRQIFLAARVDGMSVEEIARQTRLSKKQVVKRLGNAIHIIGRSLRAYEVE